MRHPEQREGSHHYENITILRCFAIAQHNAMNGYITFNVIFF